MTMHRTPGRPTPEQVAGEVCAVDLVAACARRDGAEALALVNVLTGQDLLVRHIAQLKLAELLTDAMGRTGAGPGDAAAPAAPARVAQELVVLLERVRYPDGVQTAVAALIAGDHRPISRTDGTVSLLAFALATAAFGTAGWPDGGLLALLRERRERLAL
ncbi:hypothetical protein [Kitasatospora sp. NBC_01300]|uniref:hypothetical protein n=1 Tax=Kitasatospora sp. NBC_01300 TaxID=2903574 RepID=UPI002F91726C|nr:hypothetical protein OG556_39910 [Kitasatospora sp. NBC_01300]